MSAHYFLRNEPFCLLALLTAPLKLRPLLARLGRSSTACFSFFHLFLMGHIEIQKELYKRGRMFLHDLNGSLTPLTFKWNEKKSSWLAPNDGTAVNSWMLKFYFCAFVFLPTVVLVWPEKSRYSSCACGFNTVCRCVFVCDPGVGWLSQGPPKASFKVSVTPTPEVSGFQFSEIIR